MSLPVIEVILIWVVPVHRPHLSQYRWQSRCPGYPSHKNIVSVSLCRVYVFVALCGEIEVYT